MLPLADKKATRGAFADHQFSQGEEIAHSITHGLGVLGSIAALVIMVIRAAACHDARLVVGVTIFGTSMLFLYLASTLYHGLTAKRAKRVFELMDYGGIYLLIAGTYTPFALSVLYGAWGWSSFGVVWGLALMGIFYEVVMHRPWRRLSLAFYIVLGWLLVVTWYPLSKELPFRALLLLALGGVSYTGGAIFYAWRGFPYHHALWHIFVLFGTGFHFWCVLAFVIPNCQ